MNTAVAVPSLVSLTEQGKIEVLPKAKKSVKKAVVAFLDMISTSTGQKTYYNKKSDQLKVMQDIHNAVIFIPRHRGAPIGDYPFQDLEEADIVYFKLGPSKAWRLNNSDWKNTYRRYFRGRKIYIYESGRLIPQTPPTSEGPE